MHSLTLPALVRLPSFRSMLLVFALFVIALLQAGCTSNPLAAAETPAQKYAAVKLTYDAVLSGALVLVQDTTVPAELRRSIQSAAVTSGDIYRSANTAYVQFVAAKAELAAGETRSAKLDIATANLERWLRDLDSVAGRLAALQSR